MRYNIFKEVHNPLRLALLNTCILVEAAQEDLAKAVTASEKIAEVVRLSREQLAFEEQHILPLVFEYEPSVWDEYVRQHHKTKNQLRELQSAVEEFRNAEAPEEKIYQQVEMEHVFAAFIKSSFNHMDEEEEVLNEILWRYYHDDVLNLAAIEHPATPVFVQAIQPALLRSAKAA